MVSCSDLHCCLAFRNAERDPGNQYKLSDSCFTGYCYYCSSLQYYFRKTAFRLVKNFKNTKAE